MSLVSERVSRERSMLATFPLPIKTIDQETVGVGLAVANI
jgi:hypothetical protein